MLGVEPLLLGESGSLALGVSTSAVAQGEGAQVRACSRSRVRLAYTVDGQRQHCCAYDDHEGPNA